MKVRLHKTAQFGPSKQSTPTYIQAPETVAPPPTVDPAAATAATDAANKARQARRNAGGNKSTILTSGLGVIGAANTQSNSTLG